MKWLCKLSSAIVLVSLLLLLLPSSFIGADDIINVSSGDYNLYDSTYSTEIPTVTTQNATQDLEYYATLNMDYTVGDFRSVEVRFAYKKSSDSEWSYTDWVSQTEDGTYGTRIAIDASTVYKFKALLKYNDTEIEGDTSSFTSGAHGNLDIPDPELQPPMETGRECWFATAARGTDTAKEIDILREFRDMVLLPNRPGAKFVSLYYETSPLIVDFISQHEVLRTAVRVGFIDPIVKILDWTHDLWSAKASDSKLRVVARHSQNNAFP